MPRTREEWRRYFAAHAPNVPKDFDPLFFQEKSRYESSMEQLIRWRLEYADTMLSALKILQ